MLQAKKRATPAGITLLAKPHASLGSLSSVALSSAGEKSNLSVAFDQNTVNVQSYRRNCLISPSQVSNHADSRCLTTPTYSFKARDAFPLQRILIFLEVDFNYLTPHI